MLNNTTRSSADTQPCVASDASAPTQTPDLPDLAVEAVFSRDFPMIQTVVVINTLILVIMNLGVDLTYVVLDPRVRYAASR
ncbi:MAG: hypothetical protein IID41_13370 [Planctomycetes bacterium]|nr:hypothetical protein [Planctomycetota bacterium]